MARRYTKNHTKKGQFAYQKTFSSRRSQSLERNTNAKQTFFYYIARQANGGRLLSEICYNSLKFFTIL
jgi:hypothetical protein